MRSATNSRQCQCCRRLMPAKVKRQLCSRQCITVHGQTRAQERGAAKAKRRMKVQRNVTGPVGEVLHTAGH